MECPKRRGEVHAAAETEMVRLTRCGVTGGAVAGGKDQPATRRITAPLQFRRLGLREARMGRSRKPGAYAAQHHDTTPGEKRAAPRCHSQACAGGSLWTAIVALAT